MAQIFISILSSHQIFFYRILSPPVTFQSQKTAWTKWWPVHRHCSKAQAGLIRTICACSNKLRLIQWTPYYHRLTLGQKLTTRFYKSKFTSYNQQLPSLPAAFFLLVLTDAASSKTDKCLAPSLSAHHPTLRIQLKFIQLLLKISLTGDNHSNNGSTALVILFS